MLINFFDIVMLYFICHSLIEKKIKVSIKQVALSVLYGIILGMLAFQLSGATYRALVTLIALLTIKLLSRKKNYDVLILYVLFFLLVAFIQLFSLLIFRTLNFDDMYIRLLVQTISTFIILFLSFKAPMYKVFYTIEKEMLLRLSFFALVGIFLLVFAYFRFEFENAVPYSFFLFLLLTPATIGFYQAFRRVFYYTNEAPAKIHDFKNLVIGLGISIKAASSLEEIKKDFINFVKLIGIDEEIGAVQAGDGEGGIRTFINQKKEEKAKNLAFISKIGYYEPHREVPLSVLLYMIGVLLDNAIESGTKDPILINVSVVAESLDISVANQCKREVVNKVKAMFQSGYSTKSGEARGHGLPNLKKTVTRYGGKIGVTYDYQKEYDENYLTMSIKI